MKTGDKVIYTKSHYDWLDNVGRWPSRYKSRFEFVGKIAEVNGAGAVRVLWEYTGRDHWHFADNLEEAL